MALWEATGRKHVPRLQVAYNQMETAHKDKKLKFKSEYDKHFEQSSPQNEKKIHLVLTMYQTLY